MSDQHKACFSFPETSNLNNIMSERLFGDVRLTVSFTFLESLHIFY